MNIFITDEDPVICASHHCDRHEPKMILESAQMLCAVWHRYGQTFPNMYKETHKNHPCTIWVGTNTANYLWLVDLFKALNAQRAARGKATHRSFTTLVPHILTPPDGLPISSERTPFVQAMPDAFKICTTVVSYRLYLLYKRDEWRSRGMDFTYKDRAEPEWLNGMVQYS